MAFRKWTRWLLSFVMVNLEQLFVSNYDVSLQVSPFIQWPFISVCLHTSRPIVPNLSAKLQLLNCDSCCRENSLLSMCPAQRIALNRALSGKQIVVLLMEGSVNLPFHTLQHFHNPFAAFLQSFSENHILELLELSARAQSHEGDIIIIKFGYSY